MGEGVSIEETSLRSCLVVSASSTGFSNVPDVKNVPLLIQNEECFHKMHFFNR